ncbi:MAG: tetratricopeptide repeat protein [Verrucomicrobia bacterium]|nr:tetratricopeptide repeat protein [Verrucomicrobiota bacterium]
MERFLFPKENRVDISDLERKYQQSFRIANINEMFDLDKEFCAYCEKELALNPNNIQALILLGVLLWEPFHEDDKAIEYLTKAIALDPKNVEARFWLAACYYHDFCAYEKSKSLLLEALEIDPNRPECLALLATIIMDTTKDINFSVTLLERAVNFAPDWPMLWLSLARRYIRMADPDKAESCIQKGLQCKLLTCKPKNNLENYFENIVTGRSWKSIMEEFEPQISEIRLLRKKLGQEKVATSDIFEVEKAYQKAIANGATISDVYELNKKYYYYLEGLLNENSNDLRVLVLLGALLSEPFPDREKTIQYLTRAITLDPKNVEARFWLATCYFYTFKDYMKSKELLIEALNIDPRSSECLFLLALTVMNTTKNLNQAIEYLEEGIKSAPDWPSLRYFLALYYTQIEDFEKAEFHVKAGLQCKLLTTLPKNSIEEYYERVVTGRSGSYLNGIQDLAKGIQQSRTKRSGQNRFQ